MDYSEKTKFIAEKRILKRDLSGNIIETIPEMFQRVSSFLSSNEEENQEYFDTMSNLDFLPNSPCLVNAGNENANLSACFVLGIEDSIESIYSTLKDCAYVHKSGGGTGFDFSNLRPENSIVSSTSGVASGPVSFMTLYDASTEAIKQGGVRRGANIGVLRVDHPDIEKFITCKSGNNLTNFNVSVGITDEFMEAVFHNKSFQLKFEGEKTQIKAVDLWNKLIKNAFETGDPGIIFIDKINKLNPMIGDEFYITATNPCGEVPLSINEVCVLGSINWSNMLTEDGEINIKKLRITTRIGVKMLNSIIDKGSYPNNAIRKKVFLTRKIGLGVMGVADFFIKLKMIYGSEESLDIVNEMNQIMLEECVLASHEYPTTFSAIDKYSPPPHIIAILEKLNIQNYTPANATLMTIAPTGTLSMLANCSSGIEPVFFLETIENRVDANIQYTHPIYAEFKQNHPTLRIPSYFITSHEIDVDSHIQMQATFQRYICNAVSKTINLPSTSTIADIDKAYKEAYMLGCKGVTAYIDGSIENQTIEGSSSYANKDKYIEPIKRPESLEGTTHEIKTGFGPLYVTINCVDGNPFEVLCTIGKSGASENAKAEAVGKLISLALRCGISLQHIIEQIDGIVGSKSHFSDYGLVTSIPDAIAKVLINKVLGGLEVTRVVGMQKCVDCNSIALVYEGSCLVCQSCGWKSCGE